MRDIGVVMYSSFFGGKDGGMDRVMKGFLDLGTKKSIGGGGTPDGVSIAEKKEGRPTLLLTHFWVLFSV